MGSSTLPGRRVLITGAARGIGAAVAERLHGRGARVALTGLEPERLAEVAARCGDAPWRACDVADRAAVDGAVEALVGELGGLDVVLANAGVAAQLPILGGDPAVFERTIQVNLAGVYYTLRAAGPHIAHRSGYALAIASLAAAVHAPLLGAYSASKAAVEALGLVLARELRGRDVTVNTVAPGPTATPLFLEGKSEELVEQLAAANPMNRLGAPEDVAETVAFLAGPARWVNGQTLFTNGGMA